LTLERPFFARNSRFVAAIGSLLVIASLTWYQDLSSTAPIDGSSVGILQQSAIITIALLVAGLIATFMGATGYIRSKSRDRSSETTPTKTTILRAMGDKNSFRIFLIISVLYGVFFSFASSLAVYRPSGLSIAGGSITAPSAISVVCCGPLGQMPQFVVYLTQQFAFLVIPLNLILLFAAAWMVGLNAAIAAYSYRSESVRNARSWVGGFGAIVALFSACPTCAGFFLLALLGLTSGIPFALTIASLQGLFILSGFPLLLLAPILASRQVTRQVDPTCAVP
jgi:hypothetical protein